jgi:hypothetical protein
MELEHHSRRRRLPEPDAKSGNTVADAVVSADYHGVEHADDHAAQLGLVQ